MTDLRRELTIACFDLVASDKLVQIYLHHVHKMARCDEILAWHLENKVVGNELKWWLISEHDSSILNAIAHVLMRLDLDVQKRPIIFGRDFVG